MILLRRTWVQVLLIAAMVFAGAVLALPVEWTAPRYILLGAIAVLAAGIPALARMYSENMKQTAESSRTEPSNQRTLVTRNGLRKRWLRGLFVGIVAFACAAVVDRAVSGGCWSPGRAVALGLGVALGVLLTSLAELRAGKAKQGHKRRVP